jgi:UDP-N-acetylglucosamine--N-acetylmuramyl-(pentapeptide) pyrophosphoryl-undecaprenol N-acetylglucosamine transferase
MKELKVIIAGGGTGGHIFPAVAIGHAIKRARPDAQLLFAGANGKMEMEKVPKEGFEIVGLDIAGFNRSNLLKNIGLPLKLIRSRMAARDILRRFQPGVVVGVGGYASFPMLHAAQGMRIPTLIQEQNSYAGKSNMILGKKAKAICVAYGGMDRFFPADKIIVAGNPVRKSISQMSHDAAVARGKMGLVPDKDVVLVVGGSLGAKSINEAIASHLAELVAAGVQVIWQTGKAYYEQAVDQAKQWADRVRVVAFIEQMEVAYGAASVVVSRAGALAIAELCIVGKPVIFIPYPFAAEDHQAHNAMALVNHSAAMMIRDADAQNELCPKLLELLKNDDMRNKMATNLRPMAVADADERIANKIIEIAK